jgi:hypothetical protein
MSCSIGHVSDTLSLTSSSSEGVQLWDVQEILAERTSISGDNELLVVWKTGWVPKDNVKPGPELERFRSATKFRFDSAAGDIYWAVEPGTQLAHDVADVKAIERERRRVQQQRNANNSAPATVVDRTPRKQLGSVAKRACGIGDE